MKGASAEQDRLAAVAQQPHHCREAGRRARQGLGAAIIASVGLGVIDSFAVGSDSSLADMARAVGLTMTPDTFGYVVWSVKMSQVAAILPYLLLVLILIFRPKGLFGTREG